MNKEYAEFFKNKESFIEKVILTDKEISIYHPNTKEPTIFENNKENLDTTKARLRSQAIAIVKNSEIIIKQNPRSKKLNYIVTISMIISLLLVIVNFYAMSTTIIPILFASIGITIASATTIYNLIKNANQRKELENYKFYLENSKKMRNQIHIDRNMKKYLSDDAKNFLQNKELDIIVVDKLIEKMPKDFDTLKERSIINNGLGKYVKFKDDYEQPSKPHVKKRTIPQNNELDIIVVDKLIEEMPKDFDTLKERSIINNGLDKDVEFKDDYEQPSKPHVKKRTKK